VGLDEGTHCKVCFEPKALSREPSLNMKRLTLAPKDDLLVDSWSELEEVLDKAMRHSMPCGNDREDTMSSLNTLLNKV
jgi:hypothetical protein